MTEDVIEAAYANPGGNLSERQVRARLSRVLTLLDVLELMNAGIEVTIDVIAERVTSSSLRHAIRTLAEIRELAEELGFELHGEPREGQRDLLMVEDLQAALAAAQAEFRQAHGRRPESSEGDPRGGAPRPSPGARAVHRL